MKKVLGLSLVAALALATQVSASDSKFAVSGSAAFTTNYLWRGISYTEGTLAAQAGIDMDNLLSVGGLHLNLWGSGIKEGSEIDTVIGYAGEAGKLGYDVGFINYYYTQDYVADTLAGPSYGEAFVSLSYADYAVSYYREVGYAGSASYDGNTFIADASFGPVDLSVGTRIPDTGNSSTFGSVGVNWPCQLLKGYDMNAMLGYNSGATQNVFGAEGLAFSLTLSKSF